MVTQSTSHLKDGSYSNRIQEYTEKQEPSDAPCLCVRFPRLLQEVTTQPLKIALVYPFTVKEARSLTSVSLDQNQGVGLPPEDRGENSLLASSCFWRLLAFIGLWEHHPSLCLWGHTTFSSSVLSPSASYLEVHL